MNRRRIIILFHIVFLFGIVSMSLLFWPRPSDFNDMTKGRILLRIRSSLYMMDGSGNHLQFLGTFTGSPTWSPTGNFIAVTCSDPSKLCILDANSIPDLREFPTINSKYAPDILQEIRLPESCQQVIAQVELTSISWSYDEQKLAVVCRRNSSTGTERRVCVLSLKDTEDTNCWNAEISKGINRISWSPKEDLLAVSDDENRGSGSPLSKDSLAVSGGENYDASKVYTVDPDGNHKTFITTGWNPEWSPDGTQIAVIKRENNQNFPGIAIIDKDGTNLSWVYRPYAYPTKSANSERTLFYASLFCPGSDTRIEGVGCRLSWYPNKKYLVFSSNYVSSYDLHIFRLDIQTGKVEVLTNYISNELRSFEEPDWGW